MNKPFLIEKILESLKKESAFLKEELGRVSQEAIQAPGRMESRYDSSKQELSYEANRIQQRMDMLEENMNIISAFRQSNDISSAGVGSLISARKDNGQSCAFFILPSGEGELVESVMVISPKSPIFPAMEGKKAGESFSFRDTAYIIESIT